MLLQNAARTKMEMKNAVFDHTVFMTCVLLCVSLQIREVYSDIKTVMEFLLDVGIYQTTRRHTQKDSIFFSHRDRAEL